MLVAEGFSLLASTCPQFPSLEQAPTFRYTHGAVATRPVDKRQRSGSDTLCLCLLTYHPPALM